MRTVRWPAWPRDASSASTSAARSCWPARSDADLSVHHRTNRPGLRPRPGRARADGRRRGGGDPHGGRRRRSRRSGSASPARSTRAPGWPSRRSTSRSRTSRFARRHGRAARAPGGRRQRRQLHSAARRAPGVAQGATEVALLTLGTGIGGGLLLRGEIYRGWISGGAEMGHMVVEMNGRPCQGNCPNWGCLESVASGTALVREASLAVARRPDTALGQALEEGRELTGPLITELATGGRPGGARRDRDDRPRARRRHHEPREHLQPAGRRDRRRRDRGGRAAARARARGDAASARWRPGRTSCASRPRAFGPEAGMIGAGAARARARRPASPLDGRRCPRAAAGRVSGSARRLPDADREPRGRHAARARGAARGRRRRLRGHAPHARAARALRRAGDARLLPRAQRARAGGRAGRADARGRGRRAGRPTPACRWSAIPGYPLVQGCVAAGLAVEVLPGPSSALTALVASALPSDVWRFAGFLPRKRGALETVLGVAGDRRRVRVAAPRRRVAGRARRARPRAPGRGLPRADQAPRGDRARHGRRARGALRGRGRRAARSCSCSAARRRATGADPAAIDAVRRLVEAGAKARVAAGVVAELTGAGANALYRRGRRALAPAARLDHELHQQLVVPRCRRRRAR